MTVITAEITYVRQKNTEQTAKSFMVTDRPTRTLMKDITVMNIVQTAPTIPTVRRTTIMTADHTEEYRADCSDHTHGQTYNDYDSRQHGRISPTAPTIPMVRRITITTANSERMMLRVSLKDSSLQDLAAVNIFSGAEGRRKVRTIPKKAWGSGNPATDVCLF